jgi:hypothetical protein
MANYYQTTDKILRKALAILHAKLNFIGSIHRDYDPQFASSIGDGGKIGATLRIRLPEQYTVTTGATFVPQGIAQNDVVLTVATQKHVGLKLTSADLALKDEDFEERHLQPAMSVLATAMEADALSMIGSIYNMNGAGGGGAPTTMYAFGQMRAMLNKNLAPDAGKRVVLMDSDTSAAMADGLKALFNDRRELEHAYLEGYLTRGQGFTFMENELLPYIANGTRSASANVGSPSANVNQGATSMTVTGFAGGATINAGEVFTFYPSGGAASGVLAVHPETKTAYNYLQQFVVTQTVTIGASGTLNFAPAVNFNADGYQNVSRQPLTTDYVQFATGTPPAVGGSGAASGSYQQLLAFHKDAFAFVTADLPVFDGQPFMARKTIDKLSMRIWKFVDGVNDTENTRIDVLYGYQTLRPQLACRWTK